jgi:hypothetical protein
MRRPHPSCPLPSSRVRSSVHPTPASCVHDRKSARRARLTRGPLALAAAGMLAGSMLARADGPVHPGLYVPPVNAFIVDPAETPIALEFGPAPLADVQSALDAARAGDPDSPIVLTLRGTYTVTDAPLALPSTTALVLYGTIKAALDATAPSLIAIAGQTKVAVAGGLLDGSHANLAGIAAVGATKVHLDAVTVVNTGQDGIVLQGRGNTVWNSGSAITRCDVARAGGNGITIAAITQTLVLDSFVHANAGAGIQLSAAHSSVVNSVSQANGVGTLVDGPDDLIADNELRSSMGPGLLLAASSVNTAVLRNVIGDSGGPGIDLDGQNNLIHANTLTNTTDLIERSGGNWVVPRSRPLLAPLSRYFYPPTVENPHGDTVMNARGRTDLSIDSGSISNVQQIYDAARQQNPDDVLVLHVNGDFTLDGPPLRLGSNTAVILDGTIHVPPGSTAGQAVTAAGPVEFVSISGGTIDLGGRSMEGIFFSSATMAHIDGVTVLRGGQRDVRAGKGMIHLQHGSGYNILRANTVDQSGGRCIWTQESSSRYIVLENHLTNCNMDAVDFDSSTSNSVAIGNLNENNRRYGVFIEQSDSLNKVYGNLTTTRDIPGTPGHGIGVYNNATSSATRGITDKNTVFSNTSDVIANGLRVGSIATASGGVAETAHTFFFNNVVTNNTGDAVLVDTQFPRSIENYFSQTVLSGNRTDLNSHPSNGAAPPDFFNPPPAVNLAWNQPATASSTAAGSDPASAADGLASTSWLAGDEPRPSLTVDLGSDVSFERVVLKQRDSRAIRRIRLQISEDGVGFTDIPGTSLRLRLVRNVHFAPVTARFLRVQIEEISEGKVGLEEVSVYPQ